MIDIIKNFPLICSGANRKILDLPDCETEQSRYKMIGIFIFLTAVFATLSAQYALFSGFKSVWLASVVGMLWGVFIFNLDRFIISTLRKKEIESDLHWSEKLRKKSGEIIAAIPRLLFAIVISIVISTPLELKYFEPEIKAQIAKNQLAAKISTDKQLDLKFSEITRLQNEKVRLETEIKEKAAQCDLQGDDIIKEAEGNSITRKIGKGPVFKEKQQRYIECQKALEDMKIRAQKEIDENNKKLIRLQGERDTTEGEVGATTEASDGFLAQLTALHQLSSEPGPVGWVSLFITWLFILLETTPLLMKLLSKRGPYENHLDTQEYGSYVAHLKAVSDINEKTNTEIAFNTWKAERVAEKEQELIEEAINDIQNLAQAEIEAAKAELAKEIVERWRKKNLAKTVVFATPQTQASGD